MDEATLAFMAQFNDRLARIETKLDLVHAPANCQLSERVRALEMTQANQKGIITVIGVIAGILTSAFVSIITTLFRR